MLRPATSVGAVGAITLTLAACGGSGGAKSEALTGTNVAAATRTAQQYIDAYHDKNAAKVCKVLAASVVAQLGGPKCVKTIRASYKGASFPRLVAQRSFAKGGTATVTFRDSVRRVTVAREAGAWKVVDGGT